MAKNPLKIMDTILRDAHQSQAATRMKIEDMIPILPVLDSIGYWSLECWGGATFDVCMRFLNEDPWERLRTLKKGPAQHQAADAAPRPEHPGLPALCRRRGGVLLQEVHRKRHRCGAYFRRFETTPATWKPP